MTAINPDLRFRKLWLAIGYLLIVLVIYLSLSSSPVTIDTNLPYEDKLFHFIAYFVLTFWFMQIYHIRHYVIAWVALFLCLGLKAPCSRFSGMALVYSPQNTTSGCVL